MKVNIQVQRAAEALDQRHRAALRRIPWYAGLSRQPATDDAMHDAQHRADSLGFTGEQEACRAGQDPQTVDQELEVVLDRIQREG